MSERKKEEPVDKFFICRGRLTLDNVVFHIKARSYEHAEQLIRDNRWDDWDVSGAESVDWEMKEDTLEINE